MSNYQARCAAGCRCVVYCERQRAVEVPASYSAARRNHLHEAVRVGKLRMRGACVIFLTCAMASAIAHQAVTSGNPQSATAVHLQQSGAADGYTPPPPKSTHSDNTTLITVCVVAACIILIGVAVWLVILRARRRDPFDGMTLEQMQTLAAQISLEAHPPALATRPCCSDEQRRTLSWCEFHADLVPSEDASCAICLGEYAAGAALARLPCAHHFHTECVDKWLSQSQLCPLCNQNVVSTLGCVRDSSSHELPGSVNVAATGDDSDPECSSVSSGALVSIRIDKSIEPAAYELCRSASSTSSASSIASPSSSPSSSPPFAMRAVSTTSDLAAEYVSTSNLPTSTPSAHECALVVTPIPVQFMSRVRGATALF